MFRLILNLMINRAKKHRWQLEIGKYLLKKGTGYAIGDPVVMKGTKNKTYYIANLHFDFANNRINHTLTKNKPIEKK